jgi:hypothetical protein
MRLLPTTLAVLAVLATQATVRADDAMDVVNKGITAHGGEKALQEQSSMTWKVKGNFHGLGQAMPYTADYAFKGPNKFRMDLAMNFQGNDMKMAAGSNGTKGWEVMGGNEQEMAAEKYKEFRHNVYSMSVAMMFPLKDKAFKLTSLGDSMEDGKTLAGVKVSKEGERDVSLFFDKATGLLYKSSTKVNSELQMKEVTQDVYFQNYTEKDGKKYFTKMVIKHDKQPYIEEEMTDQKPGQIDDKRFEKP